MFKGLKNDVQQVAIKVLNQAGAQQLAEFAKVSGAICVYHRALCFAMLFRASHVAYDKVARMGILCFSMSQALGFALQCS